MTGGWDVEVTEAALADAREAALYMRDRLGSSAAAHHFVDLFEEAVSSLGEMPERRPLVADFGLARLGYRWIPVGSFMMFYRVDTIARKVTADRVLFGSRDWKSLL